MTRSNNQKIAFIGAGNMARSIIGGLVTAGWATDKLFASDPSTEQCLLLERQFDITTFSDNAKCVDQADIVMLSVKPQILKRAVESIRSSLLEKNPLIISIAAGIRIGDVLKWVGQEMPFIRVMPNTPALVNCGASGLLANALATNDHKQIAEQIMQAVGETTWVGSESDIDTVTGISGSGPAYYFKLMEVMIEVAEANGLDSEAARTLVLQTALGAATLANHSNHLPGELRRQVTSPGGTTEAALLSMESNGIDETITRGINAAIEKSSQLAKTLGEL